MSREADMIEQQQVQRDHTMVEVFQKYFCREEPLLHHLCLQGEGEFLMQEQGHLREGERQHLIIVLSGLSTTGL